MMTSRRPRDGGGRGSSFASRRGHSNQLSISDTSHHITETIGTLYGDDDDYSPSDSRPLSFIAAPRGGEQLPERSHPELIPADEHRQKLVRSTSGETGSLNRNSFEKSQTQSASTPSQRGLSRTNSNEGPSSPISPGGLSPGGLSPTLQDMRNGSEYPLTSIDNPNDIAQELSNLQALRRLSMDVSNNSDPDLLPFQAMSLMGMPSIAPKGDDDTDPSRLLWVPAGVHPELAPTEFKNFVEKRVQTMKRRSRESSLSPDSLERSDSENLRRKKSMLSRQVDNAGGYADGAERVQRKMSQRQTEPSIPELSLDELMKDPTKAVQKLALESHGGADDGSNSDMPILPVAPGTGLRRSTRTTYRKGGSLKNRQGSMRNNERLPFSKRMANRQGEETNDGRTDSGMAIEAPPGHGLTRVQSEPISENFSRPSKSIRRQQPFEIDQADNTYDSTSQYNQGSSWSRSSAPQRMHSSEDLTLRNPLPQIIATPPASEESDSRQDAGRPFPERSSSQRGASSIPQQSSPAPTEPPARSNKRPTYVQQSSTPQQSQPADVSSQPQRAPSSSHQNYNDTSQTMPSLQPGSASRTDTLTFIPTFSSASDERKTEKKGKKDSSEGVSSRGSGWKWFKSDDKEKKKKDEDGRKSKTRAFVEKAQDNVRLDVLQTSIDTALHKGRESLLLDRESIDNKLEEERRKESSRRSGEQKKEKDGIFSSFFGGGKKRGDRDSGGKKAQQQRPLSPEPAPYRPMRPDLDYHWTRFPILEERAIYRMAHIKLANPRRALHSQVLLSNFMYAYLAKVQAMHPQIQVPQSPQQKRLQEEERRRREQEQQYMEQQQNQESIDHYNFEYHRSSNQYSDPSMQHEEGDYPEAAEIYDYDHGQDDMGQDRDYDNYGGGKDYYSYDHQNGRDGEKEEMW
ncbi:hypothetical protein F5Y16DRAFT_97927 [Xylariaceae sp. FL0255]|nr:hypothetical protein F5Y16DRAFT_97927 [Xylariaceae sp. FL0255]